MLQKLKSFFIESVRVFKVTKKPSKEEYKIIVKVSGLGILAIGVIGFLVHFFWQILS